MSISSNIASIRATLPKGAELLCVSKYHTVEAIREAYEIGERCFGESRVQELLQKREALPKDIRWHFIGHLQTNKIRSILPFVDLIHGVDSFRLLEAIKKEAAKLDIDHPIRVLLEVKIAQEDTKYGFTPADVLSLFTDSAQQFPPYRGDGRGVVVCGIMGMASHTDDEEQIACEFAALQTLFEQISPILQTRYGVEYPILSMGMSDDYHIALQYGSNLIRIGSSIFTVK